MEALFTLQSAKNHDLAPQKTTVLPIYTLAWDDAASLDRGLTEQFIHQRFQQHYGASIIDFMPNLLAAKNEAGITAALGFQLAQKQQSLFLEQYLDVTIESALSVITGSPINRAGIVEIGNLASARQRATQTLFLLLAEILHQSGFEWVVFTANRSVKNWLEKLTIATVSLGEANASKLSNKSVNWGSYYDDKPVVLAANIQQGCSNLNQHPLMDALRQNYRQQIGRAVAALRL